jgi:hypothetical protein
LLLGSTLRVHLSDDFGTQRADRPGEVEPTTLPIVSATVQVGIAWHNGWSR